MYMNACEQKSLLDSKFSLLFDKSEFFPHFLSRVMAGFDGKERKHSLDI